MSVAYHTITRALNLWLHAVQGAELAVQVRANVYVHACTLEGNAERQVCVMPVSSKGGFKFRIKYAL